MPTTDKRPLKVFLCHAHADRDAVRALYTRLTNDGVDAWLDKEKLLPGQDWELEIKKAVREADVVVVCLSKQFNQAGFRQKEVRLALDTAMEKPEGEIFIIPARLEECNNLESLRKWHWVDLFEDNGYEMLMRALRARANNIGATLRIKRSWLPKITSPLPKKQKSVENKTTETSDKKIVNKVDDMSPLPELSDDWEAQWQAAFVKNAKEEKETTGTKVDRLSEKKIRRPNTTIVVGFIVLVMASIFSLPSLFDTSIDEPTATQTKGEIALETQTQKTSSTPSISTSTRVPAFTSTVTPLSDDNKNIQDLEQIAYVSVCNYPELCSKIIVMNADGSEQKDITVNSPMPYNRFPASSYDGTKLLFVGSYLYDTGPSNLYMVNLSNLEVALIREFDSTIRNISWSPDGENVIYDTYVDKIGIEIEKYNLTTKEIVNIVTYSRYANAPSWSFDGSKVAYIDGQFGLYIMDPDGTHRQYIYDYVGCDNPSFSSVGFEIVASCYKNEADLFIFETTSKKVVPITDFLGLEREPDWSPDGEWIVFVSNMETCLNQTIVGACQGGDYDIYKIRPDGSDLTRLTFDGGSKQYPTWVR